MKFMIFSKSLIGVLIITFILCLSTSAQAQALNPYFTPPPPYAGFYGYAGFPPIRTAVPYGFGSAFGAPWLSPAFVSPIPSIRRPAATITLWSTVGTNSALIIYNPTALIGPSAVPVTPSPLLSLIAGALLAPLGHSALSTSNPAFYNYLVNTFLLPTGLAFYTFP